MDAQQFAELFRSLAGTAPARSRRGVFAALTSGLLAAVPFALGNQDAAAKKKKKSKSKKKKQQSPQLPPPPPFNAFGCLDVGQPCQGDSALCCSGICDGSAPAPGQPDTSVCVAHNAGICAPDVDVCALNFQIKCHPSNPKCFCMLTTGNAGFCADFTDIEQSCRLCSADTDCQAEFGPGAACVVLAGYCTEICGATGRTACVRPCV